MQGSLLCRKKGGIRRRILRAVVVTHAAFIGGAAQAGHSYAFLCALAQSADNIPYTKRYQCQQQPTDYNSRYHSNLP